MTNSSSKRKNSKRPTFLQAHRRLLMGLVTMALFGSVGVYLLFFAHANDLPEIVLPLPGTQGTSSSSERLYLNQAGLRIVVSVPAMTDTPSAGMAVMLSVVGTNHGNRSDNMTDDDNRQILNGTFVPHVFEFTRFVNTEGFELDAGYAQAEASNPHDSSVTPYYACFNISPSRYGQMNILIGTLYMNYPPDEYQGYLGADAAFAKGNCAQALSHTSPGFIGHSGWVQVSIGGAHDPGPGSGNSTTGPGTDGASPATGQGAGGGGGGGGGGSTAKTQSSKPNPLPSSTTQGEQAKQPKVEPSPFFDGKLFAAGSSTLANSGTKAVSIAGFKLGYGWFYVVGAVVALGVTSLFAWRYRQQLKGAVISFRRRVNR